jgi:hypothetical protein
LIDETGVWVLMNLKIKVVDEAIFIKLTKFGGSLKAFLNFRPYLFQNVRLEAIA